MKHLLLTTIAAVVLVGCATTQSPEPSIAEAPDISIHDAAADGNIEAVKHHLAAGTDVNAKNGERCTPLHLAAGYGQTKVAELLLANGAEVDSKDDKYEVTPLHYAALRGRKETAKLLISSGADVNAKNVEGGTPFHLAAEEGQQQIVELLISKKADINARDNKGKTPLDWAATWGLKETADLLRKHGGKTAKELKAE